MQWLQNFFGFSRAQTNGFIIMLPLLLLMIFSEPLYRNFFLGEPAPPVWIVADSMRVVDVRKDSFSAANIHTELSLPAAINPNEASFNQWVNLGVPHNITKRILKYRKKGGKFIYRTDLLKIYGFDSTLYRQTAPYINLPDKIGSDAVQQKKSSVKHDINLADSTQLVRVYGIGPVLAKRIVKYRDALGGFVAWHQLYKVYGLDSAVVDEMKQTFYISERFVPRKININTATYQELAAHPLISRELARALITYRLQHGSYSNLEDIRKIVTVNTQDFEAVRPYLTVE